MPHAAPLPFDEVLPLPRPAATGGHVSLGFVTGIGVSLVLHGLLLGLLLMQRGGAGPQALAAPSPLLVEWRSATPAPRPTPLPPRPTPPASLPLPGSVAEPAPKAGAEVVLAKGETLAAEVARQPARAPGAEAAATAAASWVAPVAVASAAASAEEAYVWDVLAHLRRFQHYPERARQRDVEGTVWLRARVSRRGVVLRSDIERSSGHDLLDRAAARLIVQSSPLPPPPAGQFAITDLRLPVEYRLRRE